MINRERFQNLVGKLIYLSHTHPDIAFVVSMVSQFMHSLGQEHFDAAYKILRYLKGTPGKGLMFRKQDNLQIEVYTDADWAGSSTDRRSYLARRKSRYMAKQETKCCGSEWC